MLLPVSVVYATIMYCRRAIISPQQYTVPIISIGNLLVGGSGKTPFVIALASIYADRNPTIISRGYGRKSTGLVKVSRDGAILVGVETSGDEAMLMAVSLPNASVIVSENRSEAIDIAISQGSRLIFLDDGFSRVEIEKYEILLEPAIVPNVLPLPSGPFREFPFMKRRCNLYLKEDVDFSREVTCEGLTEKMLLVTAIANPSRLDPYLPSAVVHKEYLDDHAYFARAWIEKMMIEHSATSLLVTEKDFVKIKDFKLPISLIKLELDINKKALDEIENYIGD